MWANIKSFAATGIHLEGMEIGNPQAGLVSVEDLLDESRNYPTSEAPPSTNAAVDFDDHDEVEPVINYESEIDEEENADIGKVTQENLSIWEFIIQFETNKDKKFFWSNSK
ncbi:hypothetical protein FQA39_LY05616 [Lamprigera yunnana]|nr:hypothetical protein FQA39_LY05616 [Lamprigera yunnana]